MKLTSQKMKSAMKLTNANRISHWQAHVAGAENYHAGIKAYCDTDKVSKSAIYRWKEYFSHSDSELKFKTKKSAKKIYESEVTHLYEILNEIKRSKFGVKSERWESDEQMVFNEVEFFSKQHFSAQLLPIRSINQLNKEAWESAISRSLVFSL